jgi:hypothetical protein
MATKILYDEKELLIHASNGSEEAFSLIFHTYKNKLYGYLFRITESSEVAEDIVQEIFLKLWKDKSDLANIISFDSYLLEWQKIMPSILLNQELAKPCYMSNTSKRKPRKTTALTIKSI